jgi:4-amino-4-deoxy-L-arabinose transferase-like glycosyltransferase
MSEIAERTTRAGPAGATGVAAPVAAILVLALATVLGFSGFIESDDVFYSVAARHWAASFPYVADNHWGLRHTVVLPLALFFRLFGESEAGPVAVAALYAVGVLALIHALLRRIATPGAAWAGVVLVGAMPVFAWNATTLFDDIPEAFYVLASLMAFMAAVARGGAARFVFAGALAGLAFMTRETTVALLVFYGVLFLIGYGGARLPYIWMGVGFVIVFGLDTAYLAAMTGDPLFRFHVSLRGVAGDNPDMEGQFATTGPFDRFGTVRAPRIIQAWLVVLLSQNYVFLFWAAIPVALAYAFSRRADAVRATTRLLGGFALTWFVVLSYVMFFLWLVPRYQTVSAAALAVPLAIGIARLGARHRALGLLALLILVGADLAVIAMADTNTLFGERALARFARTADGPVMVDAGTRRGAELLLDWAGDADRVVAGPPRPGALYFLYTRPHRAAPAGSPTAPGPGWTEVAHFTEPPRPAAQLLRASGLEPLIPGPLLRKLDPAPREASAWRVPPG